MTSSYFVAAGGLVALLLGYGSTQVIHNVVKRDPTNIVIHEFEYRDGKIYQDIELIGNLRPERVWFAKQVLRGDGEVVCGGGVYAASGKGTREGNRYVLSETVSEWADDECDYRKGDRIVASWRWSNGEGIIRRVGVEKTVK